MLLFNFTKKGKPTPTGELEKINAVITAQDKQIASINSAENRFVENGDINALISFWEDIWNNGGLCFNGSKWTFRLPDLYIKQKRYDDALKILQKIKNPSYQEKKASYIDRINALKKKQK